MSSNVHGSVILKKCDFFWRLLAVCIEIACCYRRFTTRTRLFTRIFTKLPIDYRAENGIYSHIHRRFTPLTIRTSIDMFIVHMCFGEALFSSIKKTKKQKYHFTRVCWFASHKLWCVELWVQLFVASMYRLRSNGRKVVKHFFSSSKKRKDCHTVSLIGHVSLFCRKTMLPVYNLTQFYWLPAHLREMQWRATNQGVFFLSTASSGRCLLALSPPPTSTLTPNQTWLVGKTIASL